MSHLTPRSTWTRCVCSAPVSVNVRQQKRPNAAFATTSCRIVLFYPGEKSNAQNYHRVSTVVVCACRTCPAFGRLRQYGESLVRYLHKRTGCRDHDRPLLAERAGLWNSVKGIGNRDG